MADDPSTPSQPAPSVDPTPANAVVVKKYANRRLYNTETSSYITLENLAEMIRAGRDFVVYDAKTSDDITRGVLTQIIVEEESKGSAMLPTAFLRQLIGFYGGSLEGVVPRYLEYSMSSFARQQQQVRTVMERTFSPFLPPSVEEMSRQNMALFDRAVNMWNPFVRNAEPSGEATEAGAPEAGTPEMGTSEAGAQETGAAPQGPAAAHVDEAELAWLRREVESLRHQLAAAHAAAVVPPSPAPVVPANVLRDPEPTRPVRRAARKTTDVRS